MDVKLPLGQRFQLFPRIVETNLNPLVEKQTPSGVSISAVIICLGLLWPKSSWLAWSSWFLARSPCCRCQMWSQQKGEDCALVPRLALNAKVLLFVLLSRDAVSNRGSARWCHISRFIRIPTVRRCLMRHLSLLFTNNIPTGQVSVLKYTLEHTNQLSPYTQQSLWPGYALLAAYMILVQAHTVYKYKWWPFITYTCRSAMGAPKLWKKSLLTAAQQSQCACNQAQLQPINFLPTISNYTSANEDSDTGL